MQRLSFSLIIIILIRSNTIAQCIDKEKIKFGGDYGFVNYIFHCPSYNFAINGDTSKKWNILRDPIDIKQAPIKALQYKKMVETSIKRYSGLDFYSNIKFEGVGVVYPDKFKAFSGRSDIDRKSCKANYFYYYQFKPDTISSYLIGIAVDKNGKIISPFNFPAKKYYKSIDKTFTYCKLVEIAHDIEKNIDPIDEIKLEYNAKTKQFYWLISQGLVVTHEGLNYLNQVIIDAADLSKAKSVRSHVSIVY